MYNLPFWYPVNLKYINTLCGIMYTIFTFMLYAFSGMVKKYERLEQDISKQEKIQLLKTDIAAIKSRLLLFSRNDRLYNNVQNKNELQALIHTAKVQYFIYNYMILDIFLIFTKLSDWIIKSRNLLDWSKHSKHNWRVKQTLQWIEWF